jgi:heme iron utilization protein
MQPAEALVLNALLERRPVAALATLHQGGPAVSMVPFALMPDGARFVIHVSRLASHTHDLLANPAVALLVMAADDAADSALALPRVSIQGVARPCERESADYPGARAAYLRKLPEAEDLFSFADFSLFVVEARSVRFVAVSGRAMSFSADRLAGIMGGAA